MFRETVNALAACVVSFVLCAVAYPAAVWGLGQLAFPHQAEGSLVYDRDRTVIGSELIAQPFASDGYFFPRPSAVDYKADATGGSNLGTKNPDLRKKVAERAEALKATAENPVPVDLVSASGGGMDPHISLEAAYYQAARVAAARKMPVEQVRALIRRHVERSGAIIGAPERVNVLRLNLALNAEKPEPAPKSEKAAEAPAPTPVDAADTASEFAAIRSRVGELSGEVSRLEKALDAAGHDKPGPELKDLADRLDGLADQTRAIPQLVERLKGLDGRVGAAETSARAMHTQLREAREALKAAVAKPAARPRPAR